MRVFTGFEWRLMLAPVPVMLLGLMFCLARPAAATVDWRAACGVLDGSGVRATVQHTADGGFKRCRSRSVQFGSAQPVRAAINYSVLSDNGAVSEARLVLEIRSPQDIQQAYAQLRAMAQKVVPVVLSEPLPAVIGTAIMAGIFGREWPVGNGRVALRRTGGARSYQIEVRVYP
jgi:hypothetical protein